MRSMSKKLSNFSFTSKSIVNIIILLIVVALIYNINMNWNKCKERFFSNSNYQLVKAHDNSISYVDCNGTVAITTNNITCNGNAVQTGKKYSDGSGSNCTFKFSNSTFTGCS